MVFFRMILPSLGIILFLFLPYIVGDECNNCNTTLKPEGSGISTAIEGNTTTITIPPEPPNTESKARALNTTLPPIDDVSLHDEMDMFNMTTVSNTCLPDQVVSKGCEETCICHGGSLLCVPKVCAAPMHKVGSAKLDPSCIEKPGTDPCCATLVCSQDTETEPFEDCIYKNVTYQRGENFNDACEAVCSCEEAGHVSCKPRCSSVNNTTSDRCVAVPDAKDPCCTLVLCDVSLDDQDVTKPGMTGAEDSDNSTNIKLLSAIAVNSSAVKLELSGRPNSTWTVESSVDKILWNPSILHGYTVVGLEGGKSYHLRVKYGTYTTNSISVSLPQVKKTSTMCEYKGKSYTRGEEFHDGCMFYCQCTKSGVECANIECPTDFGLDVLDPHCLSWETQPPDFVPHPPTCCPETVKCKDNGSCTYMGERFPNWADIPTKLSGCEQRCYCEMGNVTCHAACPPVPATPPADLPCPPRQAILSHQHGDECCLLWMCPQHTGSNSVDMKLNETYQTTDHQTSSVPLLGPYNVTSNSSILILGPYNSNTAQTFTNKKQTKNQTHPKKDYFPGPYSLQHMDEENRKLQIKQKNDGFKSRPLKETQLLEQVLFPFNLNKKVENVIINETIKINKNNSDNQQVPKIKDSEYQDYTDINKGIFHNFPSKNEDKKEPNFQQTQHKSYPDDGLTFPGPYQPNLSKTNKSEIKSPHSDKNVIPIGSPPGLTISYDHLPFLPIDQKHTLASKPETQLGSNPNQIYLVHNEQVQPPIKKPEHDMYHIQHFQIPYNPVEEQKQLPNIGGSSKRVLPQELFSNFHKVPQHFSKTEQIPQNFQPEKIFHIVHQHPHQVPVNHPDRYLSPEELYVYHNQGKVPTGQPVQLQDHLYYKDNIKIPGNHDTIHIHSPAVPTIPSLRVEEILAHLHQQENNHFNHQEQSFSLLPPHLKHPNANSYQETLLTQQSSHPGIQLEQKHGLNTTNKGFNKEPFSGGFPSNPTHNPREIKVHLLEAVDESTVRLVFSVPSVLVGLHGRVELRYTADKLNSDPSTWEQQVLAPPDDLIATPELEFELGGLHPDTTYKIKIAVQLRDLQNSPVSEILTVKTLRQATSTTVYPPEISVEPELRVAELNSTWVKLEWRTFSEFELQFIDGVQLRYKEPDGKVFAATPLIHRAVTSYFIEDLKPDTQYQVGIFFIPFPGQTTELRAHDTLHITTAIENDPYKFDLVLDVHHIKISSIELTWTGVPYPEDKYVNIYRAIYQSEGGREDFSSFKVAKRDAPANTLIQGLKPATRYRLWLEAYLTNGKIKKSNVKDFTTKPGAVPAADTLQGQLEASPIVKSSDYYVPLIGVSILAALAIVAVVILLLILHRKHGHNKAPITAANTRKPQSAAYDNPSYKVEIQQETMDL